MMVVQVEAATIWTTHLNQRMVAYDRMYVSLDFDDVASINQSVMAGCWV
ncbi:hypothetical protein HanRHA438_Chr06g0251831 [Helianthus annuus]|nr:hypothetical protein HanRHA438_Chr06g0251831 [Helianthus annuus]